MMQFRRNFIATAITGLLGLLAVLPPAPTSAADDDVEADAAVADAGESVASNDAQDGESDAADKDAAAGKKAGFTRYDALLASLTIFVLAIFVGFEVITKVPPTLHTPLMSGSNAISGITIVGALLATGFGANWFVSLVGMIALALATINVVGGFLVTHRMLEMFRKK